MKPDTAERKKNRLAHAIEYLVSQGWCYLHDWLFQKGSQLHDMSAADITMHQSIYDNEHFLVTDYYTCPYWKFKRENLL